MFGPSAQAMPLAIRVRPRPFSLERARPAGLSLARGRVAAGLLKAIGAMLREPGHGAGLHEFNPVTFIHRAVFACEEFRQPVRQVSRARRADAVWRSRRPFRKSSLR